MELAESVSPDEFQAAVLEEQERDTQRVVALRPVAPPEPEAIAVPVVAEVQAAPPGRAQCVTTSAAEGAAAVEATNAVRANPSSGPNGSAKLIQNTSSTGSRLLRAPNTICAANPTANGATSQSRPSTAASQSSANSTIAPSATVQTSVSKSAGGRRIRS